MMQQSRPLPVPSIAMGPTNLDLVHSPRPLLSPNDVFHDNPKMTQLTHSRRKRKPRSHNDDADSPRKRFPSLSLRSPNDTLCVNSPGRSSVFAEGGIKALQSSRAPNLGRGSFGSVVVGSLHGRRVAVKIIPRECGRLTRQKRRDSVCSERLALGLKHAHLVRLLDVFSSDVDGSTMLVMEYVGKANLLSLCEQYPERMTVPFVIKCLQDVSSALSFVHSLSVLHLDVKPGNVFVTSDGVCKLGDFGCARKMDEDPDKENKRTPNIVGTSGFQAPELLKGCHLSLKSDIYSFGVLCWQLMSLEQPFSGLHPHTVIFHVVSLKARPKSDRADASSLSPLFKACWRHDAKDRPEWPSIQRMLKRLEAKMASEESVPRKRARASSMRL